MEAGYVVVTFGSDAPDWCNLNHCPMDAHGPFPTSEAAHAAADRFPEWQQPHVLRLTPAEVHQPATP